MSILQTIKDIKRLRHISNVLFKQGLGYITEQLKLKSYLTFHKRLQKEKFVKPEAIPVRLRKVMEELGGTFTKLGQLLSLRPDLIPAEYCEEFSKLQDHVRPFPFILAKQMIEQEFKKPLFKMFSKFERTPIAAASVGQVHKAVLKSGEVVAVKIQRPKIKQIFITDIDILYHIAKLVEKHIPEAKNYNPVGIVREFESYTKDELDYFVEAKNIDTFYKNFKEDPTIRIPKVYWDYTTPKVLTMEFIDGVKIKDVKNFGQIKCSKEKIVENLNNSFVKQYMEYGYFHADPHPGNVIILKNNIIGFLDFGIVGRLSPIMIEKIEDILISLIKPDVTMLAEGLIEIGVIKEEINIDAFREDLILHFDKYYNVSLKQISAANIFYDCFAIGRKYDIVFPTNFVLLTKSLATLNSVATKYYPEYNFVEACRPAVEKIMLKRASPTYMLASVKKNITDFKKFLKTLPKDAKSLVKLIKEGAKVNIDVENKDIRQFSAEIDRSSNRLTFGIIIAALIIGAFLTVVAKQKPVLFGLPALGLICVTFVIILTIALLISISREPKGGETG